MNFEDLRSKGDFMNFLLENDNRIKELDSAIPSEISKQLLNLGLDNRSSLCTCYWKNGYVELINVVEHATTLYLNK